jgi:hypothetical protein
MPFGDILAMRAGQIGSQSKPIENVRRGEAEKDVTVSLVVVPF